jgi:predicted DNA-binding protein (MmcQ/YjbR family)
MLAISNSPILKPASLSNGVLVFEFPPSVFLELTDQIGIKPARYMHRFHWISIVQLNAMDSDYLKVLIHDSYQKALRSLSKKAQASIATLP